MLGSSMGVGMAPGPHPDVWRGQKKVSSDYFTMPNNVSSMKCALKSVPGLPDVGVPMGMGMAPELHPDVWRGSEKSFI